MKSFLLVSFYAPKLGFAYPNNLCAIEHRDAMHNNIYALSRFFDYPINWTTINAEKSRINELSELITSHEFDYIFLSGSPFSVYENQEWIENAKQVLKPFLETNPNVPILGICFGAQLLAHCLGGTINKADKFYTEETRLTFDNGHCVPTKTFHQEYVSQLPTGARSIAYGPNNMPYFYHLRDTIWGIQSHPEALLTCEKQNVQAERFWKTFLRDSLHKKRSVNIEIYS